MQICKTKKMLHLQLIKLKRNENTQKYPTRTDFSIQVSNKLVKYLQNKYKEVHYLMNIQARSRLLRIFAFFVFSASVSLQKFFVMSSEHWDTKYVTLYYYITKCITSFLFFLLVLIFLLFLTCKTSHNCIKNVSRMFLHVSKWPRNS